MQTFSDIKFDNNLYSQVDHGVLILYELKGLSVSIPLPSAQLLTFINYFDNISNCQEHIDTNNRKTFTLFAYSGNLGTWLLDKSTLPDNLEELIIFCPAADEKDYWKRRMRRYPQKIKSIITFDQLELELLMSGMNYIKDLLVHFQNDNAIFRLLKEDYEKIRLHFSIRLEELTNKKI